jgi:hypothetical protein
MKLLRTATIKIGEKDFQVKRSIRAYLTFEALSGHSIEDFEETMKDSVLFFFSCFQSGGNKQTYEEFLDLIDEDPDSITAFLEAMTEKTEKKQKAV